MNPHPNNQPQPEPETELKSSLPPPPGVFFPEEIAFHFTNLSPLAKAPLNQLVN
jgi:hypothetical protein